MKRISLNNNIYTLPTSYKEETIQQFISCNGKTNYEEILSILTNIDLSLIDQIEYTQYADIIKIIDYRNKECDNILTEIFTINNIQYGFISSMTNMMIGEFIDYEKYNRDSINNLHILAAILFRPLYDLKGTDYKVEKYNPEDLFERASILREMPIEIITNAIKQYEITKNNFYKIYKGLFSKDDGDEPDRFNTKWGWQWALYTITGNDKFNEKMWRDEPIHELFNRLAMLKEKEG